MMWTGSLRRVGYGTWGLRGCLFLLLLGGVFATASVVHAQQAMMQDGSASLFQRVLTLPDATIHVAPGNHEPVVLEPVPVFSIYYVYGEKLIDNETWLEIGVRPQGGGDGWLRKSFSEDWKSMLVMEYAPMGQRGRVLFFEDHQSLQDLVEEAEPARVTRVRALRQQVDQRRSAPQSVLAVEPDVVVDTRSQPYLMPILDAILDEQFYDGTYTTLVQVAGLNQSRVEQTRAQESASRALDAGVDLSGFRLGIVFVIDTTISMGPYIDRTYDTVRNVYAEFERTGTLDRVVFGLVGYRDFVEHNPALEYVTRIYQPLSLEMPPSAVLENLRRVRPSRVSTEGWAEDAFAGLYTAIHELDWEPFGARIIVHISDAGARPANDPRVMGPRFGATNVVEAANRKGITIFPMHLRTPEAARFNDIPSAEQVYRAIGRTGDSNVNKYLGVEAGSVERFEAAIKEFSKQLRRTVEATAANRLAERPELSEPGDVVSRDGTPERPEEARFGDMLVNEIFRAQLEYIGRRTGAEAPRFYRAWAADRDLDNPRFDALGVSVFLNRTQLSGLAQSLQNIVHRAQAADLDPGRFFDMLQSLSATMATDPNQRAAGQFDNLAESGLLPDYLSVLPYHSQILQLNRDLWLDWGFTGQQEFITWLEHKIEIYRAIDQDVRNWVDLGANEPGLEVYPIPLAYLP